MARLRWVVVLLLTAVLVVPLAAQRPSDAAVMLESARQKAAVDGDLAGAIVAYRQTIERHAGDHATIAAAWLHIADLHRTLGDTSAATQALEQVLALSDQPEAVAAAQEQLGRAQKPTPKTASSRLVWTVPERASNLGTISPNGQYLGFVEWSTGSVLFLRDFGSQTNRQLTEVVNGESTWSSAFSPDSNRIAYNWYRNNGRVFELRILDLRARAPEPQTLFSSQELEGLWVDDWSPDGRWLAVRLRRRDRTAAIGLISAADGRLQVLKTIGWRGPTRVVFAPDSRSVAFDLPADESTAQRDVFLLAIDGSRERRIVTDPLQNTVVGFADNGARLLYMTVEAGGRTLWGVRLAGGEPQGAPEVLRRDVPDQPLGVTSDGALYMQQSAPSVTSQASDIEIGAFDFNRGTFTQRPTPFVTEFVGYNVSPDWSADGSALAYVSGRPSGTVIAVRSTATGRLLKEIEPAMDLYSADPLGWVRWAPDGRSFVGQGVDGKGRSGLHRIDANTGATTPLVIQDTGSTDVVRGATWSPDGARLYYHDRASGGFNAGNDSRDRLIELDLASGRERTLFRSAGFWDFWLSPDGRHAIVRNLGERGARSPALVLVAVESGTATELRDLPSPGPLQVWAWSSDGTVAIVQRGVLSESGAVATNEWWRLRVPNGTTEKLDLTVDPALTSPGSGSTRTSPDGTHIAFVRRVAPGPSEIWRLDGLVPDSRAR